MPVDRCLSFHQLLIDALTRCPTVLQKLPVNILTLDVNSVLVHLRASLDEQEWNYRAWPAKVLLAEQWLTALNFVAPGRKSSGISDTNKERLLLIEQWQLQGFSKSVIAEKLNISRSHLSHLLKRYATRNHTAT